MGRGWSRVADGRASFGEARSVEARLENGRGVLEFTLDRRDRDLEVEHLLERQVCTHFVGLLRGNAERARGGQHTGAAVVEHGVATV